MKFSKGEVNIVKDADSIRNNGYQRISDIYIDIDISDINKVEIVLTGDMTKRNLEKPILMIKTSS